MEVLDWVVLHVAAVLLLIPGFIVTVFAIVFFVVAIALFAHGMSMLHHTKIRGRIVEVRVQQGENNGKRHMVNLTYEYIVNGQMYLRRTEDDGGISTVYSEAAAKKRADALRRDRDVMVRLDPANPKTAVAGNQSSMAFAAGTAMLICALVSMAFAIHIYGIMDLEPYVRLVDSEIKSWWQ